MNLHFKESDMLNIRFDHCFWKHRLNHFVHVVVRLEVICSLNTILVYQFRFLVVHFVLRATLFLLLSCRIMKVWTLRLWVQNCLILIGVSDCPVKAYVTGSLMSQLESTFGVLLWHSSENEQSLLRFVEKLWFFS